MALKYLILFVCCLQYFILAEETTCLNPKFDCRGNDPHQAFLTELNMMVQCPENHKCNKDFKSCKACIEYSKTCDDAFTCGYDLNEFQTPAGNFKCGKNTICNVDYKAPCKPCVEIECKTPPSWSCYSSDVVIIHNMYMQCAKGFYCNKDNEVPCKACIDQNGNEGTFTTYTL